MNEREDVCRNPGGVRVRWRWNETPPETEVGQRKGTTDGKRILTVIHRPKTERTFVFVTEIVFYYRKIPKGSWVGRFDEYTNIDVLGRGPDYSTPVCVWEEVYERFRNGWNQPERVE